MRGAQIRLRQSRRGDTPAFVLHGGTRGPRPQRDGEGGTSFASERSGTAGGTIKYEGLTGAEGVDFCRDLRLRPSRRELPGTRREARFERSGAGRTRARGAQKGRNRRKAGWGAEAKGPDPRAENSAALRSGAPGQRTEKARRGHRGWTRRKAGRTLRLTEGRAEAQNRGREQQNDHFPAYRPRPIGLASRRF